MAVDSENLNLEIKDAEQENAVNFKDLFIQFLRYWYWFAISVFICLGVGVWYMLTTPKVYTTTAELLVKETSGKKGASDVSDFAAFDLFQSKSNINNELATFQSPDLMSDVVTILNLNFNYTVDGRFHRVVLYGKTLPVNAYFQPDSLNEDLKSMSFDMQLEPDSMVRLSDFKIDGKKDEDAPAVVGRFGSDIATPAGNLSVLPTEFYRADSLADLIHVSWITTDAATKRYDRMLSVTQEDEKSTVINLAFSDVNTARAKDVINTLMSVYNRRWVDDKNQIATSTSRFINERLAVIERELGNVDSEISSYKSENLVPDLQAASNMYMQQASAANQEILQLNNQLEMANMVRSHLLDPSTQFQLVPVNTGFESPSLSSQINTYNQKVLDRNALIANSSETNPIVLDINNALVQLRGAIITSIDNHIESIRGQIRTQERQQSQAISQISSNPQQAQYLLSVERQQMVKESLYLYLLQKREENELSQAFTAYNTRIIAKPRVSDRTTPVGRNIYLLAFIIGLAIPAGIIYLRMILNTTVRGRKDIENIKAPYVGEIPFSGKKSRNPLRAIMIFSKKKDADDKQKIVVKEGSRNIINEAFRVIRANLEFMAGSENKIIAITSANPGSGKTFVSFNLAYSFAIKGKKVLMIDLDLRKGSLSKYAEKKEEGIADFLAGCTHDIESLIFKPTANANLSILPMGTMPPNPTELLYTERFAQLLEVLRDEYDLIFVDCPPVEIVADAQIINKYVDMTVFIIRAGLFERSMIGEIQSFYTSGRYKNMSILLNGTVSNGSSKYGYRYGYKYGYGSGSYGGYANKD